MRYGTCSDRPILAPCSLPTHDFQIDPYVGCAHLCRYCYALNRAETDWSEEIRLHRELKARLARELDAVAPQRVYMGCETDPYQPCEAEFRQTRTALEMLLERGFSASILTKSDLPVRDLDLLTAMDDAVAGFSLAFADDAVRTVFEVDTMPTSRRMEALRRCKRAGLRTSAMICPVVPYVNDPAPLIEHVRNDVDKVWVFGLSMGDKTDANWQAVRTALQNHFPAEFQRCKEAIFDRNAPYWTELRDRITAMFSHEEFELSVHF